MDPDSAQLPLHAERVTCVLDALRALVRAIHVSGPAVERQIGITGAQLLALQQLDSAPGESVSELAGRIGIHQSSASAVLARLVSRRLVKRRRGAHNARRREFFLTERGRAVLDSAPTTPQSRMLDALRRMQPDQLHRLAEALDALVRGAGIVVEQAPVYLEEAGAPDR